MSLKNSFFRDVMLTAGCTSWTDKTFTMAWPKKRHWCIVLTAWETRCGPFPRPPLYHLALVLAWSYCTGSGTAYVPNQTFTVQYMYVYLVLPTLSLAVVPPSSPIPPSCGSSRPVALALTQLTLAIKHLQWRGKMSASGFGSTGSVASCDTTSPPPPHQHQPASKSKGI